MFLGQPTGIILAKLQVGDNYSDSGGGAPGLNPLIVGASFGQAVTFNPLAAKVLIP